MRSIEDIFDHEPNKTVNREVLFEDDEWCIYRRPPYSWVRDTNHRSYVLHRCAKAQFACDNDGTFTCECGEVAPDSIKTLFILQTWDAPDEV
jgi:hypothetical protein